MKILCRVPFENGSPELSNEKKRLFEFKMNQKQEVITSVFKMVTLCDEQSCTQIIRPLARSYSYDYDLRKTNYIFK